MPEPTTFAGFVGQRLVARGSLIDVALALQAELERAVGSDPTLIDDSTGQSIGLSLHGTPEELRERIESYLAPGSEAMPPPKPGPGRPRLGVVSREISLLPRHWEWLGRQPGGASATLRRLVDQARKDSEGPERTRQARDAAYRFLQVMGGDLPGFEEAIRALFAGDWERVDSEIEAWPVDIRDHARRLVARARDGEATLETPRDE